VLVAPEETDHLQLLQEYRHIIHLLHPVVLAVQVYLRQYHPPPLARPRRRALRPEVVVVVVVDLHMEMVAWGPVRH
jgi:hypothetical protein